MVKCASKGLVQLVNRNSGSRIDRSGRRNQAAARIYAQKVGAVAKPSRRGAAIAVAPHEFNAWRMVRAYALLSTSAYTASLHEPNPSNANQFCDGFMKAIKRTLTCFTLLLALASVAVAEEKITLHSFHK